MSVNVQVVVVVNNLAQYERYIKNNPYYKYFKLTCFDNTKDNISISSRYNDFIDKFMFRDSWVIFSHQDFFIKEDLFLKLKGLDMKCIYGPIGVKACKCTQLALRLRGMKSLKFRKMDILENRIYGQIRQDIEGDESKAILLGQRVNRPYEVDTVDSCCLLIHSSLIREYGLRFDEMLDFNLFAADLSIAARKLHGIKTKILQLDCFHLSPGRMNMGYFKCLVYLVRKYPEERIALTFSDAKEVDCFKYFFANKRFEKVTDNFFDTQGLSL